MKKKKSSGPKRMMELGKVKVEVWLSEVQVLRLRDLAARLGTRPATLARRCINYVVEGGENAARPLRHSQYD